MSQSRPRSARPSLRGSRGHRSAPGRQQPASRTAAPAGAAVPGNPRALPDRAAALAAEWAPWPRVSYWAWSWAGSAITNWSSRLYGPATCPRCRQAHGGLAVLAHGWVLLMLAVALMAGIATRLAAGIAAITLLEIVVWLAVTASLSDLVLRDLGVLGPGHLPNRSHPAAPGAAALAAARPKTNSPAAPGARFPVVTLSSQLGHFLPLGPIAAIVSRARSPTARHERAPRPAAPQCSSLEPTKITVKRSGLRPPRPSDGALRHSGL